MSSKLLLRILVASAVALTGLPASAEICRGCDSCFVEDAQILSDRHCGDDSVSAGDSCPHQMISGEARVERTSHLRQASDPRLPAAQGIASTSAPAAGRSLRAHTMPIRSSDLVTRLGSLLL
jgi:hypothetical protein